MPSPSSASSSETVPSSSSSFSSGSNESRRRGRPPVRSEPPSSMFRVQKRSELRTRRRVKFPQTRGEELENILLEPAPSKSVQQPVSERLEEEPAHSRETSSETSPKNSMHQSGTLLTQQPGSARAATTDIDSGSEGTSSSASTDAPSTPSSREPTPSLFPPNPSLANSPPATPIGGFAGHRDTFTLLMLPRRRKKRGPGSREHHDAVVRGLDELERRRGSSSINSNTSQEKGFVFSPSTLPGPVLVAFVNAMGPSSTSTGASLLNLRLASRAWYMALAVLRPIVAEEGGDGDGGERSWGSWRRSLGESVMTRTTAGTTTATTTTTTTTTNKSKATSPYVSSSSGESSPFRSCEEEGEQDYDDDDDNGYLGSEEEAGGAGRRRFSSPAASVASASASASGSRSKSEYHPRFAMRRVGATYSP